MIFHYAATPSQSAGSELLCRSIANFLPLATQEMNPLRDTLASCRKRFALTAAAKAVRHQTCAALKEPFRN